MAFLFQHFKSPYWIAGFRDSTGKRVNRSTKIRVYSLDVEPAKASKALRESRLKAMRVADSFERAARGELTRETHVRETLAELLELVGGPKVEAMDVSAFFVRWLSEAEKTGKSETTLKRYRQVARDFLEFLDERSRRPIEEVSPADVKGFLAQLAKDGLATKTIANALKILRIPFAEAVRLALLPHNPALAVKPPQIESVEKHPFTIEEVKAMLETAGTVEHGKEWQTTIMLAYYTGMRLGNAAGMDWSAIDFPRRAIVFTPEKGKKRELQIPMHPALESYLLSLPLPTGKPRAKLCPNLARFSKGERGPLSKFFTGKIMAGAGVERVQKRTTREEGRGRMVSEKSFHSFRHTLTTHLAEKGVSAEFRMAITGHSSAQVHAGYCHLKLDALREAIEQLS